jgi:death on curing protein
MSSRWQRRTRFISPRTTPFIDGNKRAALASALVFLDLNGIDVQDPESRLYPAMMEMASGQTGKAEFTGVLQKLAG